MKLAFSAIVKGTDKEADALATLLTNVRPYVDNAFITITQPNSRVEEVAKLYNCTISHFEWCNDFAAARNFNFAQVGDEYDYVLWGDADDTFTGLDTLKKYIEDNPTDAYAMMYEYDHDKYGMANVVHPKTMVVANDGTFSWVGKIHEDLKANREIQLLMLEGVTRVHHPNKDRVHESAIRNKEIALASMTGDPRDYWNLANAYTGTGEYHDAIRTFLQFLDLTQSDIERYMALLRVSSMYLTLGETLKAEEYARKAIAVRFDLPDAYHSLGHVLKAQGKRDDAIATILEGLKKKPATTSAIVYNPRDYDYNPLMMLAHLYWESALPRKALECLKSCKQIQPQNEKLDAMIEECENEAKAQEFIIEWCKNADKMTDDEYRAAYNALTEEQRTNPIALVQYNMRFIKTETSGKDLVYYCGQTTRWTPDILKQGIGGSEEAVINLTKEFAKAGYNVTVYNNCGDGGVFDGVTYRPWYLYNYRDKHDILIVWRNMRVLDYDLNVGKIFVDIHDAISEGEFTKKRIAKIDKVFLKSDAHRELFPSLPNEKIMIVPNAMDVTLFDGVNVERDPYLIINTSSPDRALSALVRIFPKIKAKEPRARMKWAYGFDIFDLLRAHDKEAMAWKKVMLRKMEEAGVENLGKISHADVAKLNMEAGVYLYPTHFYEIDCVSVRKAQLGGVHVVSSEFAALKTTNKHGYKVHSPYTKDNWCPPYSLDMSDDPERDDEYVEKVLEAFKNNEREQMQTWARTFTPNYVANIWLSQF